MPVLSFSFFPPSPFRGVRSIKKSTKHSCKMCITKNPDCLSRSNAGPNRRSDIDIMDIREISTTREGGATSGGECANKLQMSSNSMLPCVNLRIIRISDPCGLNLNIFSRKFLNYFAYCNDTSGWTEDWRMMDDGRDKIILCKRGGKYLLQINHAIIRTYIYVEHEHELIYRIVGSPRGGENSRSTGGRRPEKDKRREPRGAHVETMERISHIGLARRVICNIRTPIRKSLAIRNERKSYIKNGQQRSSCLLYTSPSPRDRQKSRMPSSA